jgi:DNA-binding HxlR family transcriptional regulator
MTKIEDYVREIPEEIRRAIRGLDNKYRTAIFVALYKNGELSFSDLEKELEIDKAMLTYHLGRLIESALVHHYYRHELGTEKYSFYNVTPFGQNFVEILNQFLRPQPCPITFKELNSTESGIFIDFGASADPREFLLDVLSDCYKKWRGTDYIIIYGSSDASSHVIQPSTLKGADPKNTLPRLIKTPTI